ncbi:MAG TPA: GAF domain-containing protein [Anaerolineales bacterium]|nr:GAF domain-containing protein [Anaerolineales bacterium]
MKESNKQPSVLQESMKTKLLVFLLSITAAVTISLIIVAFLSTRRASLDAQQISSQALLEQAEKYLKQLNHKSIQENELTLEGVKQQASNLASFTAALFSNPSAFASQSYWNAEDHLIAGAEGQFSNSADELSSVFVPNFQELDALIMGEAELSAYLELVFTNAFESTPNIAAIYFATPRDVVRYYPNIDLGSALPPDFKASQRVWFTGSTPEENPERSPWWTPTYTDATGRGLVTTIAVPVYSQQDEFIGVVGFDFELKGLKANIEGTQLLESGYAFLIDESGQAIALPEQGYRDFFGYESEPEEGVANMNAARPAFSALFGKMQAGQEGFEHLESEGRSLFVAYGPLPSSGWSYGSVVEEHQLLQDIVTMKGKLNRSYQQLVLRGALPFVLLIFAASIVIGWLIISRMINPLHKLEIEARKIGEGNWNLEWPIDRQDEVGRLAQAMKLMAEKVQNLVNKLESHVLERTRALEASAVVSRRLSNILKREVLLREVVEQLRMAFDYYHVHIYLLDEQQKNLVMMAGTGQAGEQLLERGHKIPIGKGLVGQAAETKATVLVGDVTQAENWLPNPILLDTRSELAVPIMAGEQVLGVLDVQADTPNGLKEADVTLVESIASQAGIALKNAEAYAQAQSRAVREAKISSIVQQIQATSEVEDALKITVRELGRALKAPQVRVVLRQEENPIAASAGDGD